jgi:hypothetical protein
MTRSLIRLLSVCLLVVLFVTCQKTETPKEDVGAAPPKAAAVSGPPPPAICAVATKNCNGLSQCAVAPIGASATAIPDRPCTLNGEASPQTQELVDIYSWNIFLAMNWPGSSGNCNADSAKNITAVQSGDGTYTVWQTYMPGDNVFVNPGYQKPAAWCSGNGLSAGEARTFDNIAKAVANAKKLGGEFLKISAPGGDVLQASGDVVTDQSQRWLRYERLMNKTEYDYMVPNRWNAVQLTDMVTKGEAIKIPKGSIEIKSAWKVLTPSEVSGKKYFTTRATVCNTPDGQKTPCDAQPVTLGLVGLHIVQQTNDGGTMFWSTFEHVDNDTVFFNPASNAAVNTDFAKQPFTELDASCKGINIPTQIKRVTPIPAAAELNTYYQQLLAGSVFSNYQLISTQWTTGVGVTAVGTPQHVSNITLETYVQKAVDKSNGATGCMACHFNATTNVKSGTGLQNSNHSFFFLEAQYATMPPKG